MLLLLTAAILMMATTGTCLAQASLPAAEAEAYYATNDIRIVTSADLARNDYVRFRRARGTYWNRWRADAPRHPPPEA